MLFVKGPVKDGKLEYQGEKFMVKDGNLIFDHGKRIFYYHLMIKRENLIYKHVPVNGLPQEVKNMYNSVKIEKENYYQEGDFVFSHDKHGNIFVFLIID